jgi:hypothetical protein
MTRDPLHSIDPEVEVRTALIDWDHFKAWYQATHLDPSREAWEDAHLRDELNVGSA